MTMSQEERDWNEHSDPPRQPCRVCGGSGELSMDGFPLSGDDLLDAWRRAMGNTCLACGGEGRVAGG